MKKPDIARRLARQTGISAAQAADQLDRAVQRILQNVRAGQESKVPGLGKFLPAPNRGIAFKPEKERSRGNE